jgi:hypothetical protein
MGRNISSLNPQYLEQAVAYLRRALEKNNSALFVKPTHAGTALAQIEGLLRTLKPGEASEVFRSWLGLHLTPVGRGRLLNALRRKRADAKPTRQKRRVISLTPQVYRELAGLQKKVGGVPIPKLLESLSAIANVDKKLQEKLLRLSVALSLN